MDPSHKTSDAQSLILTQAAVSALLLRPALAERAISTLDHWDRIAPAGSKPLRDEWRDILVQGDFARALALTDRGQQLRQASPLARVIDPVQRLAIIRACKGRNSNI